MAKNTKLIKKALRALGGGKVRLCGGSLKDGSNYCAVGFLAAFAGRPIFKEKTDKNGNPVELPKNAIAAHDTDTAIDFVSDAYGISRDEVGKLVDLNDAEDRTHKLSRVERLRFGLKAQLSAKTNKSYESLYNKIIYGHDE